MIMKKKDSKTEKKTKIDDKPVHINMSFDETMERLVRVKPPKKKK
jgi:hypothetical protein